MKICKAVFSCNRPEYLARTLEAQSLLDFSGCEVHGILIDDYPRGRDNLEILTLAGTHGYSEVHLHGDNLSLGVTWRQFWDLIRDRDYDYVYHSEDDVQVLEPVRILDLVDILRFNPNLSQVVLRRQPWYFHELPVTALDSDWIFNDFRIEADPDRSRYFSPMASLYGMERVRFDYDAWFLKYYPNERFHTTGRNEGLVGKVLLEGLGLRSGHLKNKDGHPLLMHIGEYQQGQILLPGEVGAEIFSTFDPNVKRFSKTGIPWPSA